MLKCKWITKFTKTEVLYEKQESIGFACVVDRISRISTLFSLCFPVYGTMGISDVESTTFFFGRIYGAYFDP